MMDLKFAISIQERGTGVAGVGGFAWGVGLFVFSKMSTQNLPVQRKRKKKKKSTKIVKYY